MDFALVRHALNLAKNTGMDEVDLEIGESKFHAVLDEKSAKPATKPKATTAASSKQEEPASKVKAIKSHNVGIYRDQGHHLKVGQEINVGDVIGAVVALGIANDVVSTVQGKIAEVNVLDSEAVEYGQILVVVEVE